MTQLGYGLSQNIRAQIEAPDTPERQEAFDRYNEKVHRADKRTAYLIGAAVIGITGAFAGWFGFDTPNWADVIGLALMVTVVPAFLAVTVLGR